jgi:hypothetical protein
MWDRRSLLAMALSMGAARNASSQPFPQQSINGAWGLHSIYENDDDGEDLDQFDMDPHGQMQFDSNGRFFFSIFGSAAKFRSGNRLLGSRFELGAAARFNLSYYGTYEINATRDVLTLRIDRCSFANWNGSVRSTAITIKGNKLELTAAGTDTPTGAFFSHSVWWRLE